MDPIKHLFVTSSDECKETISGIFKDKDKFGHIEFSMGENKNALKARIESGEYSSVFIFTPSVISSPTEDVLIFFDDLYQIISTIKRLPSVFVVTDDDDDNLNRYVKELIAEAKSCKNILFDKLDIHQLRLLAMLKMCHGSDECGKRNAITHFKYSVPDISDRLISRGSKISIENNPLLIFGFLEECIKETTKADFKNLKAYIGGKEFFRELIIHSDLYNEKADKGKERRWHGYDELKKVIIPYIELVCECVMQKRPMVKNILWIENDPTALKEHIRAFSSIYGFRFHTVYDGKSINALYRLIKKDVKESVKYLNVNAENADKLEHEVDGRGINENILDTDDFGILGSFEELEDLKFDLAIIDLNLFDDPDGGDEITGEHFVEAFTNKLPEIPIFILSSIEEYEIIREKFRHGADYYLLKKYIAYLPKYIRKYLDEMGSILSSVDDEKRRRKLLGCMRYWRFKKEYLWFGDKCYHMINHSYNHTLNDWEIANQLVFPLLQINRNLISSEDVYCLSMAIWLHDIGHRGNERIGDPHIIRDYHGIIAGEMILAFPKYFEIVKQVCDDIDLTKEYGGLVFPVGKKGVCQVIKEKICEREIEGLKQKPTIIEKIALLCIFHKSNCPVTREDMRQMLNAKKIVPDAFFNDCDPDHDPITLEDILGSKQEAKDFISLVALFRFIDGLDSRKNRVGDSNEGDFKKQVIKQDKHFQLLKIKKEIEDYIMRAKGSSGETYDDLMRLSMIKTFYGDIKDKIERGEAVNLSDLSEYLKQLPNVGLQEFFTLVTYASYISFQDGHFNLHSSIDDIKIDVEWTDGKNKVFICFISNKTRAEMDDDSKSVKELGKETKTIFRRIIGTEREKWEDGYVFDELKTCQKYLKRFFLKKDVSICMHCPTDTVHQWYGKQEAIKHFEPILKNQR